MKYLFLSFLLLSFSQFGYSQLSPNLEYLCADVQEEDSDNPGETKFTSPYEYDVSFMKLVNDGIPAYFMTISAVGPVATTGNGIVVYLGESYTIKRSMPTQVYENEKNQFIHTVTFELTKQDISMLKYYLITNFEIYMYPSSVDDNMKYQAYLYCLEKI